MTKPDEDGANEDGASEGAASEAAGDGATGNAGRRPLGLLFGDTVAGARRYARLELGLARAEITGNIRRFAFGIAAIGIGFSFVTAAIVLLTQSLVEVLAPLFGPALALLVLASLYIIAGWLLLRSGFRTLSLARLWPARTVARLAGMVQAMAADPAGGAGGAGAGKEPDDAR